MGLIANGIRPGDRVGITSRTRNEWSDADLAVLSAGAIVVGIYPTAGAGEQEQIIRHSGCRLIFVENDELIERILAIRKSSGLPERLIVFDAAGKGLANGVSSFSQFKKQGDALDRQEPGRFDATWRAVKPDYPACKARRAGKGSRFTPASIEPGPGSGPASGLISPRHSGFRRNDHFVTSKR